jgi:hypothetical protein
MLGINANNYLNDFVNLLINNATSTSIFYYLLRYFATLNQSCT